MVVFIFEVIEGRLKMRESKTWHGQKWKGGKCGSRHHGWKMQEWKSQEQIAGVEMQE